MSVFTTARRFTSLRLFVSVQPQTSIPLKYVVKVPRETGGSSGSSVAGVSSGDIVSEEASKLSLVSIDAELNSVFFIVWLPQPEHITIRQNTMKKHICFFLFLKYFLSIILMYTFLLFTMFLHLK